MYHAFVGYVDEVGGKQDSKRTLKNDITRPDNIILNNVVFIVE